MENLMLKDEIREDLFKLQDTKYRDFQSKLIPTVDPETIIGVRTPELRKLSKQLVNRADISFFLDSLPHQKFDENQLHAFLLSEQKDYEICIAEVERFLPFIDNWATCDQLSPKVFRKHKPELLEHIRQWLQSNRTYTVRFAVRMLMDHFLDDAFNCSYPDMVADLKSDEYYINMMIAWYFATALAKQYESALPYLEQNRLSYWTHNKTIQKSIESYRITPEQKNYLKSLTRKKT